MDSLIGSRKLQECSKSCVTIDASDQACATSSVKKTSVTTSLKVDTNIELEEDQREEEDGFVEETDVDENPFGSLKTSHVTILQDIVEEMGLNTKEGVEMLLSSIKMDGNLIQQLMQRLEISEDTAKSFLEDWRQAHKEANRQKLQAKTKFQGMEAIWHCAVCGRGGLPQPVCYVAPYISGYHQVPL